MISSKSSFHFFIFSFEAQLLINSLCPSFFIFGRFGLEMTCIAIIDTTLKKSPMPIKMTMFNHNYTGVLGYISLGIPTASIPAWKPYLKGERYMIGQKMTLISLTLSRLMKKPPRSMKGMMSTGTNAIAVSNLGINAAQRSPQLAEQKQTPFTIATSKKHSSAVCKLKLVAQQMIMAPAVGYTSSKGKLIAVLDKKQVDVLQLLLKRSRKNTGLSLAKVARVPWIPPNAFEATKKKITPRMFCNFSG